MKNPFHVMLIPTLGCPANCEYCWSSDTNSPVMSIETVKEIVEWLKDFRKDDRVTFTFHGGEPLLAGEEFYRKALPLLSEGLNHLNPEFAIQTNLWLMTPETAKILAEYRVPVGSSIDGPEEINDLQRGTGYYRKTLEGYKTAIENGLSVRFICTFTNQSAKRKEEIFEFFYENGLVMKLHPALPSLRGSDPDKWALPPEEYGELLVYLLDMSLEHLDDMEIMNISDLCRGVFTRRGNVCTFADCMGTTFAIGPDGAVYPCYRFVGMPEYVMGNVYDRPTMEDLSESQAWKLMHEFKDYVDSACSECRHIRYCRGGCPYNAIVPCGGKVAGVDPHCPAYKRIYDEITDRMDDEMFSSPPPGMSHFGGMNGEKETPGVMSLIRKIVMN